MANFKCELCSKEFKTQRGLEAHMRKLHTLEKPYKCDICSLEFHDWQSRKRHEKRKHGKKKKADLPHFCNICNKWLVNKEGLQQHRRVVHTQNPRIECSRCLKSLKNKKSLLKHQKYSCANRAQQLGQSCIFCSKKLGTTGDLFAHIRSHIQEKPYCCPKRDCVYRSVTSSQVRRHWMAIHGLDTGDHRCHECGKSFKQKSYLSKHLRLHTGKGCLSCEICGRLCLNRSALERHLKSHSKKRPFPCPLCSKPFKTQGNCNKHLHQAHTKERPFKCSICSKSFYTKTDLNSHSAVVHKINIRHSCVFCDKSESNRQYLDRHIRTHIKEKPEICFYCRDEFSRSSYYRHMEKQHAAVEEGPIDDCDEVKIEEDSE